MNKEESMEDKYELVEIIVRSRDDGVNWFEIFFDLISENCQGVRFDETGEEGDTCTCGLEYMGGTSGTLQQCYDSSTSVGQNLQPIDLARALVALSDYQFDTYNMNPTAKAVAWARKEIEFEESFAKEDDES